MRNTTWRPMIVGLVSALLMVSTQAGAQKATDRFVSFVDFVQSVSAATSAQYIGQQRSQVSGVPAFDEMRQHILRLYDGVHVTHSYILDSQYFDCVPVAEQPAVRLQGPEVIASPPPSPRGPTDGSKAAVQVDPNQKVDQFGNSVRCETGTIPMRRITLEELSRFRTLHEFFHKGPDGAGRARFGNTLSLTEATHKYAHAYQTVANHGGSSVLNIWKPKIVTRRDEIFSLSQHWYMNFTSAGKVQTVEGGWQNYPQKYHVRKSVLFIYWTADGYTSTGCYNLDCAAFVQTDASIHLGSTFSKYSKTGAANQAEFTLTWQLYQGNWWLWYGTTAVGYYPGSLYAGGPLATSASGIDYGGETVGSTIWPLMGSGRYAKKGFGKAAYHRAIYYIGTDDALHWAGLTPSQPSPSCYTIDVHNDSGDPNWGSYFFFGGPGGKRC